MGFLPLFFCFIFLAQFYSLIPGKIGGHTGLSGVRLGLFYESIVAPKHTDHSIKPHLSENHTTPTLTDSSLPRRHWAATP